MAKKKKISKQFISGKIMALALAIMVFFGIAHFYDDLKPLIKAGADYAAEWILGEPEFAGNSVSIADGDTITVVNEDGVEIKIRLYGIDAPENTQAYGKASKKALEKLINGQELKIEVLNVDRYGRQVCVVKAGKVNVNEAMLADGHAWYYGQYCKKNFCRKWEQAATKARKEKKGLWADKSAIPPWEYRK